jgi:diguanylate cyclase (GGDEF)-like protein
MRAKTEALPPGQIDPRQLHRLFYIDHFCLLAAAIAALANLFPGVFSSMQSALPANWLDSRTFCAMVTLCAAMSLFFSEETQADTWKWGGRIFAVLASVIAGASLLARFSGASSNLARLLNQGPASVTPGSLEASAGTFLMLGIAILLISYEQRALGRIADGIVILLSVVVLSLVLDFLFAATGISEASTARLVPVSTVWCLALLTLVVIFRRSERGFLSILWGYGTGSRLARMLAPPLLLLPLFREILRAQMLKTGLIPARYAGAVLVSVGTILTVILLLLAARVINRMQENVQELTLRDELTGLHSVKGFYLLAEQAFRYSRRVNLPFGVLFIDMDNLKTINDQLGHSVGSVSLVETAKLLQANFRETDVIGRVGGDEFIVAGQFAEHELLGAMERLQEASARKNQAAEQRFSISLSMGFAVTEDCAHDNLRNLVKRADEAMYEEKRAKKKMRPPMAIPSEAIH